MDPMSTENKPLHRAMVELRRSSAASPHRNRARYTRKAKHTDHNEERTT